MKYIFRRLIAVILSLTLLISSAFALTVDEALELLEEYYVYQIPEGADAVESLDELFALLGDPYTVYMTAEEYQQFLDNLSGAQQLVGIGVEIVFTDRGILIDRVLPGGSAEKAGLKVGDLIVRIDGTSCVPAGPEHQQLISGEEGSTVELMIRRGEDSYMYLLTRRQVVIPTTEAVLLADGIGYIQCATFGMDTGEQIAEAIKELGEKAGHWILDLRSNGGGYTDAAVESLGVFAGPGIYLHLLNKAGGVEYYSHGEKATTEKPLIVLLDSYSASSSEALASGIRDMGRGLLVGDRSFGKGVAQIMLDKETSPELFDGDALKITAYRFYSAAGNTTDRIGVIPHLMVEDKYAAQLAEVLCTPFREDYITEGQMMIQIGEQYLFPRMEDLRGEVGVALLAAISPDIKLNRGVNTYYWEEITPEEAAELLGVTYQSRWFTDVDGSPYAHAINTLGTYRLLLGDGTGKFHPQRGFTRAEVCYMLAQLLDVGYEGSSRFADVADDAPYSSAVNAMAELGFVEGVGGGQFRPDGVLTQQEFFTILGRMARFLNFRLDVYTDYFYDENGVSLLENIEGMDRFADWAQESVALLNYGAEALNKQGTMLFAGLEGLSPDEPILRGEAAQCLYGLLRCTGII